MPADSPHLHFAILAGGASKRMGLDKAAILIDGETLLERTVRIAQAATPDETMVAVVGREMSPEGWRAGRALFLADSYTGAGPLAGLETALSFLATLSPSANNAAAVALLACDMPALTVDALRWLQDRWFEQCQTVGPPPGFAVAREGQLEPLFSVYSVGSLPLVRRLLAGSRRSLQSVLREGAFPVVSAPPGIVAALTNVNTPEELSQFLTDRTGRELG